MSYTQCLAVSSGGVSGGLALLWKRKSKVDVWGLSHWYIDALIDYDNMMRYGGLQDFMVILRPTKGRKHGLYLSRSNVIIKSLSCALDTLTRLIVVLRRQVAILDQPDRWIDFIWSYITVLSKI